MKSRMAVLLSVLTSFITVMEVRGGAEWHDYAAGEGAAVVTMRDDDCLLTAPSFVCTLTNGSLVYADTHAPMLRLRRPDGSVREYKYALSDIPFDTPYGTAYRDAEARRQWFQEEVVMFWLTNIRTKGNQILMIHRSLDGHTDIRSIQVLNSGTLGLIATWEDRIPFPGETIPAREPAVVTDDGQVILTGERGELLWYSPAGTSVVRRLTIPGLFNASRSGSIGAIATEDRAILTSNKIAKVERRRAMVSEKNTAALGDRDATLPSPVSLSGTNMPSQIEDFAAMPNGDLILLDGGTNIFRIVPATGATSLLRVEGLAFSGRECLLQVRAVGTSDLFVSTEYRICHVSMNPTPKLVGVKELPESLQRSNGAWDVLSLSPPRVIYANLEDGTVDEVDIPDLPNQPGGP